MATKREKQELMAALSFQPRNVTLTIQGYGGEIVMGRITTQQYEFWRDRDDLSDYAWDWEDEVVVPEEMKMFPPGDWADHDDICHECGCELSDSNRVIVQDQDSQDIIWQSDLGPITLMQQGVTVVELGEVSVENQPQGTAGFTGQSIEKGTFLEATFEIRQPFDPSQLLISYHIWDDWCLISGVTYRGEELDGLDGYSTTGKSSEFRVWCNQDQGLPELSEWHDAARTYPQHPGCYDIQLALSETHCRGWYVNDAWRDQHGDPIPDVSRWRGLNEQP